VVILRHGLRSRLILLNFNIQLRFNFLDVSRPYLRLFNLLLIYNKFTLHVRLDFSETFIICSILDKHILR